MQKRYYSYETLREKVDWLLFSQPGAVSPPPPQKPTAAFRSQTRILTIYPDRVEVCGVKVWGETESSDLRTALLRLSCQDASGCYQGIAGKDLVPDSLASSNITAIIKRFRDNASEYLLADRDLECGSDDIIANERRKGYYLQKWIKVVDMTADERPDSSSTTNAPDALPETTPATVADMALTFMPTKRQLKILQMLSAGGMRQKMLIDELGSSKTTISRDMSELRQAGLCETGADKLYVLTEAGQEFMRKRQKNGV